MKSDAVAFGIAGVLFGLIAGWIIGSQQASPRSAVAAPPPSAGAVAPAGGTPASTRAAVLDETKVSALRNVAERETTNPTPRVDLGNLYFDAERYDEAIKWYSEALKLAPKDINVSTDLAVSYYYQNQIDRALQQFDHSLELDAKHLKTLLNRGIVLAFGKQDLEGAAASWQKVISLSPDSQEGQAAKRLLDNLKSAHPGGTAAPASTPRG
jgi:tetratricopeptide (TPR) repeat protein